MIGRKYMEVACVFLVQGSILYVLQRDGWSLAIQPFRYLVKKCGYEVTAEVVYGTLAALIILGATYLAGSITLRISRWLLKRI